MTLFLPCFQIDCGSGRLENDGPKSGRRQLLPVLMPSPKLLLVIRQRIGGMHSGGKQHAESLGWTDLSVIALADSAADFDSKVDVQTCPCQ